MYSTGPASNLQHAVFNSADVYVPMLAGAAFGKVFTESGYRALVGKARRERPEQIEQVLNFEESYSRVLNKTHDYLRKLPQTIQVIVNNVEYDFIVNFPVHVHQHISKFRHFDQFVPQLFGDDIILS